MHFNANIGCSYLKYTCTVHVYLVQADGSESEELKFSLPHSAHMMSGRIFIPVRFLTSPLDATQSYTLDP